MEYRRELCEIEDAPTGSNPFDIFSNTIKIRAVIDALEKAYGSPDNHINLFPVGIAEANDGKKFLGRAFGCILGKTFQELREGDRFYYENDEVVTAIQQREVRKMTMARVMCLTLRDITNDVPLVRIQRNVFDVFNPDQDRRIRCRRLLNNDLSVEQWLINSKVKI